MLRVVVESAKGLPKNKLGSTPDPVASIIFKGKEVLQFDLKGSALDSSSYIDVIVKDYETIGKDKFLGSAKISLKDLATGQVKSSPSHDVALVNEKGQAIGVLEGGGEERDEDFIDVGQSGYAGGVSSNGQPGNPNQRLVRSTRKWNRPLANKPQDFQIRVRIIEGRQLPGNNIKPVVKVNVCGQTHRTRIRRGNNPFFDEMFFYNVNMLPLDLFDQSISFRVYDSFSLRADSLMGDFKVAIGFIYDGPDHSVMRKWLLLNDPDDYSSGARGYLKVSMFIVGTGDEPPVEKRDVSDDQDDIESNLLMPAGVTLRWVTLSLKVFRAEDIPQMDDAFAQSVKDMFGGDGNKKNLVDPFVEARFAGKKLCTQVIEKNANPEWNQMLNLQVKFPSMCEQIKLTIFDWDRLTRNDSIGTTYLNLGKIASSGGEIEGKTGESEVGFLPAFGPCYVNLYGSPREFTGLPDPYEELNYGKGEGVAYRGRILVELSTKLEGKPDKTVDAIPSDDILVAQKYQRRRKYCLCAVFHSASMLQEPGEPIQFEVSIGNYGNKLDTTCKPLSSTTQYSCAVFDGNHYYYLPWADIKPVVVITSFWEDISHRLDAVNIILYISERLQSNITAMKTAILAKASDNRLAEIWLRLVNQLIDDLDRFKVPDLEGQSNLTALDIQIKKLRDNALQTIMEGADRMRDELADIKNTLVDIEGWLDKLKQLADEPQNSMPDVIIWMLRGETRVAYSRIPAHQLLYSTYSEQACGQFCGRTRTILMQYPMDKNKGLKVPVQIRVNVWLGLSAHEKKFNTFSEGTFSVFAELYENQAYMLGKWGTTGLGLRHKYSDVTGKLKLKQEYFMPPRGWEWEGEWFIDPEKGLLTEADAGHTEFIDEVFQNETRFPGGEWKPAAEPYADVNGEKTQNPGEMECPAGWSWEDEWAVDDNRAVDEKGWEYGITIPPDEKPKSWVPAEKMYHVHRRRRVVRPRKRSAAGTTAEVRDPEGWEFSSLIGWKFHRKVRSTDTIRRRRWRRKMAPADRLGASAIFKLEGALGVDTDEKRKDEKVDASKPFGANTPTVSCSFDRSHVYHLRIYIYQARNLVAMDKDSFSDPYAHVSFLHMSQTTETMKATLNPTWDQTLIFHNMEIYGDPQNIAHYPPDVVLEFYDNDQVGKHELLGRSMCVPLVKLNPGMDQTPQLLWSPITHKGRRAGEVLVAAELILTDKGIGMDLPLVPPKRAENLYMVPQGIRPVVQLMAIEILAWGLRNMKTYQLATVSSPSLVVECGGEVVQSAVIKNMKKSPNFPGSVLFLKVLLPKEEMYTPPIVLKVIDHRPFGRKPVVGQCTIDTLEEFRCDPYIIQKSSMSSKDLNLINFEKCRPYLQKGYDTLKVYDNELEEIPEFKQLTDFCRTFKLKRGKNEDGDDDPSVVGEFKGSFKVYPLSDDPGVALPPRQFRELPKSGPQECLVRIYVVRGIDLQPKDNNGQCDPYMKIALGKKSIEDRDNYLPNTTNPVFGRMFEMTCFLPEDKDLKISVYDYDLLSRDEKVGETVIDLENRFLSRFGSYCGLPQTYCTSGINQWRDQLKPSQILQNLARLKGVPPPMTEDNGNTLSFNGEQYTLAQFVCLFSWMPGMEEDKQKTDVHYRSLDGDGNFNWRFIFGFEYLPAEQLCLVSKKEHFWSLDKTEFRIPPKLIVQIWDNDKFSLDDYLGTVELDLCNLTPPAKTPEKCSLGMMEVILDAEPHKSDLTNSLFAQQSVRGWWPCVIEQDGKEVLGGKVEMTLEIVAENEVDGKPAGKGRDEPNMNPKLDFPNRPDTSFFWFTNPCKTMKFILCRKFKCMFIGLILLILVLLFIGILLYSLPNYISMKIVKPFQ
uniref:C2 domain-containing protein n=1 Tax=Oncorhynchus tshawytscha TaxID=74940 RepID=A0A8C8HQI0_ONCTS